MPSTAVVIIFLGLPLILLFRYSLNRFVPGQFMVDALTGENYVKFFSDPYYFAVLKTTVLMAVGVTIASLIGGFPVAIAVARAPRRIKSLLIILTVIPLFVGNAVRAAGWMVAFGQKGVINAALETIGVSEQTLMYTPTAVFIGIVSVNLPFVILTLQSVLEGIDPSTQEAAANLGASPFEAFRLVTLPLALPGVVAAGTLCFILTMNAYATPLLLGGPRFQMMAPVLANEVLNQNNWPFGGTIAFVLIGFTLLLTAVTNLAVARRYAR
ncbi:MAG: ABC transporter permease [Rhizobiales bacterium]|nr:ABC transporter permease [Hyphomicrobiales bacterium]